MGKTKATTRKGSVILAVSDLHFGIRGTPALYGELRECLLPLLSDPKEEVRYLFFCGDVCDRKLSLNEEASKFLIKFMDEVATVCQGAGIVVRVIQGTVSHDLSQMDNFRMYEGRPGLDFRVLNTVTVETLPFGEVLYVPEEYMEDPNAYYSEFIEGRHYSMIFGHGTFSHVAHASQLQESERQIRTAPVFDVKEWSKLADLLVFGHVHSHSIHKNVVIPGSFTRWCFGEEKPKGFVKVVYGGPKDIKVSFVENAKAPKYSTLTLSDIGVGPKDSPEAVARAISAASKGAERTRVKLDDLEPATAEIVRGLFAKDQSVSVDVSARLRKEIEEEEKEEDEKYSFVTEGRLRPVEVVQKYIEETVGKKISVEEIEEILS